MAYIYNLKQRKIIDSLNKHKAVLNSIKFMQNKDIDMNFLVTGDINGHVYFWNLNKNTLKP